MFARGCPGALSAPCPSAGAGCGEGGSVGTRSARHGPEVSVRARQSVTDYAVPVRRVLTLGLSAVGLWQYYVNAHISVSQRLETVAAGPQRRESGRNSEPPD